MALRSQRCIEPSTTPERKPLPGSWTESRRKGDEDPDKALLAEMFKLLGNSAYGKLYTRDQRVVDKARRRVVRWHGRDWRRVRDSFERRKWRPTGRSGWNRSSCECCGFITIVWTISSIGEISNSYRWTPTVCIWGSRAKCSKNQSGLSFSKNSKWQKYLVRMG